MKRLSRLLLWLPAGVVILVCILLLGVNLYVQSQGTHHRIQQELSHRLNTPLHLRQISVTPWDGLKLSGITIPQESPREGNFLEAKSFQLRVKFWSLFAEHLVIRQVLLVKPEVVWAQNSAGKWRLPELPPEKKIPAPPDRSLFRRRARRLPALRSLPDLRWSQLSLTNPPASRRPRPFSLRKCNGST